MHKPGTHLSSTTARLSHFINCPDVSDAQSVLVLIPAQESVSRTPSNTRRILGRTDRRTESGGRWEFVSGTTQLMTNLEFANL